MFLFPVTINFFSPYLVIKGSFEGIIGGSLMVFLAQFLTSLFFGRAFCGWLCPAGGIGEACFAVNSKPVKTKVKFITYLFWILWLSAIAAGFLAAGVKSADFLYMTENGISVFAPPHYIIYFAVVGLVFILSVTMGKRSFCHRVCWMAPFMILGSKIKNKVNYPSLKLLADREKCISCKACEKVCPMSLPVQKMVEENKTNHTECILCGSCADHCPKGVLKLKVK